MARIIHILTSVTDEVRDFLSLNKLGTPGLSMVYKQMRTLAKLENIPNPQILVLRRSRKILATCCLCRRDTKQGITYYVRYFSFHPIFRSGVGDRTAKHSVIKKEIHDILNGKDLNDGLIYAYIDNHNVRSMRLCDEFRFKEIGKFETLTFSRLWPKKSVDVIKATANEYDEIRTLLSSQYENHNFYNEENLFFENDYYLIRDAKNQLLAGIQAVSEHWLIESLPGKMGRGMITFLSYIPVLKKLISKNFKFLCLDYVYCRPGAEKQLEELIETILNLKKMHVAMLAVDIQSPIYKIVIGLSAGPLGFIKKPVTASIIARRTQEEFEEFHQLSAKPNFISTLDIT